jgi:hypothetical protein
VGRAAPFSRVKEPKKAGACSARVRHAYKTHFYLRFVISISVVVTRWPGFPRLIMFYDQYIDASVLLMLHAHF